ALTYVITPGYAEALRIRLREGRLFTSADRWPGTRKMLVSEEFARQYLSGPAVGRRLAGLYREDKHVATEIIGVVADVLKDGNETAPQPAIYFLEGSPTDRIDSFVDLVVRTDEPAILATALRDIIRESDSAAAVDGIAPLETLVARSVSRPRLSMTALLGFAAMALVIASVGLAGIVGQTVLQRRREFGIRAAIGATRLDIARLVLQEGIAVTGAGTALGLALASWLTRYMRTTLFGVGPLDALTFMSAAGVVVATAVLACAYPAFRAASVNPIAALRAE
ncbi:MAG TPA: FtsX-like permease family protein, partial [Vicinamibacterales bacterium]|nr:FtsX-like permease family protein [Vicinamibacterales bacterium]